VEVGQDNAHVAEKYHVCLTKDYLVFSAAHFITYDGNVCERLHGHNYRVEAEIYAAIDENHYVVDFIALRDALASIVTRLDHRMLLPRQHHEIAVHEGASEVEVTFQERRWVFPREDCLLLPVANTTTELLARSSGLELIELLQQRSGFRPARVRVGVDENHGQWGYWDYELE
jgi:6-pyruvoyltetrahydropterin/6-carboxytetrahydropterin synthase